MNFNTASSEKARISFKFYVQSDVKIIKTILHKVF
jgi:hypothetical protein